MEMEANCSKSLEREANCSKNMSNCIKGKMVDTNFSKIKTLIPYSCPALPPGRPRPGPIRHA